MFTISMPDLPGTRVLELHIDTADNLPISVNLRRYSEQERVQIHTQVDEMFKSGIMRPQVQRRTTLWQPSSSGK